jgi:hypothetical protein
VVIREREPLFLVCPSVFPTWRKRTPALEGTHFFMRDLSICLRVVIIIDLRYYVKFNETRWDGERVVASIEKL